MKAVSIFYALVLGVAATSCSIHEPSPVIPAAVVHHANQKKRRIERKTPAMRVEFGSFAQPERGAVFKPTRTFRLVPGVNYGWRLHVTDGRSVVPIREELQLPQVPKVWTSVNPLKISDDGRTGITTSDATVLNGMIEHATTVAQGDPAGHYVIRLYADDKLIGTFHFDLVEPTTNKSPDLHSQ